MTQHGLAVVPAPLSILPKVSINKVRGNLAPGTQVGGLSRQPLNGASHLTRRAYTVSTYKMAERVAGRSGIPFKSLITRVKFQRT